MKPVLHSFAYTFDYLREQVADLSADQMVAQPSGILNHPAWTIGHLTFVCQMLGGAIGIPPWLPESYANRFSTSTVPVCDAGAYESKQVALDALQDAQSRITQAVEQLDDAQLDAPFPDPSYRDVFPSVRHALTQVLIGHAAYHVGQVSVWRKAMGLRGIGRVYE